MDARAGDVVDFLLRGRYHLSALELLHELVENGLADSEAVSRLNNFFADPDFFPPDQLQQFQLSPDPQKLLEDKTTAVENAAVLEYELRLAREDIKALQEKLAPLNQDESPTVGKGAQLDHTVRNNLNCAVKEYLISAGYKLTAMTLCEEVSDQDLDDWPGRIPNALQVYYRSFLSASQDEGIAAGNKSALLELEAELSTLKRDLEIAKAELAQKEIMACELTSKLQQTTSELELAKAELIFSKSQDVDIKHEYPEKVIGTVDSSGTNVSQSDSREVSTRPPEYLEEQGPSFDVHQHEQEPGTIQILADALPKIVPYVLINHREELLPLIICAIGRHPDNNVRDSLTHTLFNLIKRPDQGQRRIIMDACMSLSRSIGQIRTETELLPQCWEQIDHKYEERRLLVAHSCGELGRFVRPDMRSSLILSILEQLVGDPADVVREAASHNLAILLPLFPNTDKYSKVEKMTFQLLADPSGQVVETTSRDLVPSLISWSGALRQLLTTLLNRLLGFAQCCPPMSGVESSSESQLRALGERERWNIEVLLRLLKQLLPEIREACILNCQESTSCESETSNFFSKQLVEQYLEGNLQWENFDWLLLRFFPSILQLSCMLPPKEEALRRLLCDLLIECNQCFGDNCHKMIVLPMFLHAVGDDSALSTSSHVLADKIESLYPKTSTAETLSLKCTLPLLLAGVLGASSDNQDVFSSFLKELVLQSSLKHGPWSRLKTPELVDAIRFVSSFEHHHLMLTGVFWELVMNQNASVKVNAALLLKELVPSASTQLVTNQLLPALITLGSDTNLDVKYTSIGAFGTVAQHFRDEAVTEKIRVQMDAFLDEGSNEAIVGVVRALTIAVPLAAPILKDYLLQKLVVLTSNTATTSLARRREKADAFCEAIRCLDATGLSASSVKDLLLPAIQNLMKDPEVLDPAHKEALEVIIRERSGFKFDSITKVVGNMSSMSMTSIFGEAAKAMPEYLNNNNNSTSTSNNESVALSPAPQEQGVLKRMMMRTNFGDIIRGRGGA